MASDHDTITLHSSWRGIVFSMFGAVVILVLGVGLSVSNDWAIVPVSILLLGVLLTLTVLLDYPVASTFHSDHVERRAMLRRHRIAWVGVDQMTRTRPGVTGGFRQLKPGGLAAKIGRRRYLLVDQCESLAEFRDLSSILSARVEELGIDVIILPGDEIDPTWTYRSRRWSRRTDVA